jgi:mobilome CxxCx(11)CxxC protein
LAQLNNDAQTMLDDQTCRLLTDARTWQWKLEAYEFAYDGRVRRLAFYKTLLEFLAVLVAILFLYLQYLVKEHDTAHAILGYVGAGASLLVILFVVWGYIARWPDQIEKKRELSSTLRDMIGKHRKLSEARPVDREKTQKWIDSCLAFEEQRKHELATVPVYYLKRGFQHVGNAYPGRGVNCTKCGKDWVPGSNKRARYTWVPFFGCDGCGV